MEARIENARTLRGNLLSIRTVRLHNVNEFFLSSLVSGQSTVYCHSEIFSYLLRCPEFLSFVILLDFFFQWLHEVFSLSFFPLLLLLSAFCRILSFSLLNLWVVFFPLIEFECNTLRLLWVLLSSSLAPFLWHNCISFCDY